MPSASTSAMRRDRYGAVAITLHWVMAAGVLALAALGLIMVHVHLPLRERFALYQLHKSIGVTVLLLACLRLAWRLLHQPPPLPSLMPPLQKMAAHGGHILLYVFLIFLPLSGWALVSASVLRVPTRLYGVIPWPHLPVLSTLSNKEPIEAALKWVHRCTAWTLLAVIAGHAAAALYHHFIEHDDVLRRMLPRRRKNPVAAPLV
jgi:cytochrome b561